jgi:Amt family ammonium transporter
VTATLVWSFVMSMIILKLIDLTIGLRVTADEERQGLDISQHGESIE